MPDAPKPSLGRIVLVPMPRASNNGASIAPAVITRVWSDTTVNVRVLADARPSPDDWRTSATYVETLDENADVQWSEANHWTWPPRV